MAYGFIAGEVGHGDVRMLVPADVKRLSEALLAANLVRPTEGDFALLEWPTTNREYEFRLTFLQPGSGPFQRAEERFTAAQNGGAQVGEGASWLPPGLSPAW